MISLQVKGARETQGRLARAQLTYRQRAENAVRLASLLIRKKLVERMTGKLAGRDPFWGKRSPGGSFLGARSGMTRARLSPGGIVIRRGNSWFAPVGSPDKHVRLHEYGGTVFGTSPKGFLRIPTAAAQTPAGLDRYTGMSIRNIPGVFLRRFKSGNLWAVRADRGKLTLLYLLKRSVNHRPRGIFAAVSREMDAEFAKVGAAQMQAVVNAAGGS